jgi:hypothetical protein
VPRSEVTGRKTPPEPLVLGGYSIRSFCRAHGDMSEAMYFKMKAAGEGPTEMMIGRRRVISVEAAAEWRRKREAAAKKSNHAKQEVSNVA